MIDTHSHPYVSDYDDDRDEMLRRAQNAGIQLIMCPAIDSTTHAAMLELCGKYPSFCLPMMGVHPTSINDNPLWHSELDIVEEHLATGDFCAVGEVGLDLHWSRDYLAEQTAAFERQIDLARRHDLPLAIHTRDAWPEMVAVLEKHAHSGLRGVLHAFSGTLDDYRRVRLLGDFVLGVGGPATYRKNHWLSTLPAVDVAHIVLETDAPWLSPTPLRGQRNESANLTFIRDAVAAILGIEPRRLAEITTANARRIFNV